MAVDLICPDCGGIIGGSGTDADGRGPCTCCRDRPGDSSDTVSIPVAPKQRELKIDSVKRCILCGKDVTGHRRVKDSRGYLCYDCAKKEIHVEKAGTIPCADCKRRIKEAGLINYQGRRICKICYDFHKEQERLKKKVPTEHYEAHEKRTIIILSVVFSILALILVWHLFIR